MHLSALAHSDRSSWSLTANKRPQLRLSCASVEQIELFRERCRTNDIKQFYMCVLEKELEGILYRDIHPGR